MRQPPQRQGGLSLVELMVAITLGLTLMAALGYIFLGSRQSFVGNDAGARMQESGRFVMDVLQRNIAEAGYVEISAVFTESKVAFNGTPINGEDGVTSIKAGERLAGTDYLAVSLETDADCLGNAIAAGTEASNELYISATNELMCDGSGDAAGGQVVAEGVEDLQLRYGLDENGDGSVDIYKNQPASAAEWSRVLVVQACVLVRSTDNGVVDTAQTYRNCAGNDVTASDRRLRRAFTAAFSLRNRGT